MILRLLRVRENLGLLACALFAQADRSVGMARVFFARLSGPILPSALSSHSGLLPSAALITENTHPNCHPAPACGYSAATFTSWTSDRQNVILRF
jgi:hypothetical protein